MMCPVHFHIFGEMLKGREYSILSTTVYVGTFHYTISTLCHKFLCCHSSSFQICPSFAHTSLSVPLVPMLPVGLCTDGD